MDVVELIKPPPNVFEVLRRFNPNSNDIDRRILYEITGKKVSKEDTFWDSSDDGNCAEVHLGENTIEEGLLKNDPSSINPE